MRPTCRSAPASTRRPRRSGDEHEQVAGITNRPYRCLDHVGRRSSRLVRADKRRRSRLISSARRRCARSRQPGPQRRLKRRGDQVARCRRSRRQASAPRGAGEAAWRKGGGAARQSARHRRDTSSTIISATGPSGTTRSIGRSAMSGSCFESLRDHDPAPYSSRAERCTATIGPDRRSSRQAGLRHT